MKVLITQTPLQYIKHHKILFSESMVSQFHHLKSQKFLLHAIIMDAYFLILLILQHIIIKFYNFQPYEFIQMILFLLKGIAYIIHLLKRILKTIPLILVVN